LTNKGRIMTNIRRAISLLLAAITATPAPAQMVEHRYEDVAALDSAVATSLGATIGTVGGAIAPIDRRLRLATCSGPVVVEPPVMGAATVRCAAQGWRIRVPIAGAGRVPSANAGAARGAAAAPLVRRGDEVALVIATGNFTVSGSGIAETGGAEGDRIRVRIDRNRSVSGAIRSDSSVIVSGFN
jgi:flagellar basal body P-ring formation protein FlgA